MCWGDFRRVYVGERDQKAIRETKNKTTQVYNSFVRGSNLNCQPDTVESAGQPQSRFSTVEGAEDTGTDRRNESTKRQERGDQLLNGTLSKPSADGGISYNITHVDSIAQGATWIWIPEHF